MNIFGWMKTELADALREEGIPRFRADQIIRWMYQRGAVSFDVMDNLPKLLRGQLASVNLIPINPVVERHLFRPPRETVLRFQRILEAHHVTATVRREMGTDIQAACGQLRSRLMEAGL